MARRKETGVDVLAVPKPRKKRNKGRNHMTPDALERLRKNKHATKKEHPSELPPWSKIAIVKHELLGQSWAEIAAQMGKAENTLHNLKSSPAAKKYREALKDLTDDPVALAREILRGAAVGLAVENLLHYEAAKNAGDMGEAGRQLRFLTETVGVATPKSQEQAPTKIEITFGGMAISAELPMGESSAEKLLPPVIEAEIVE